MAEKRKRKETVADKINRGLRSTKMVCANFTKVIKAAPKRAK